MLIICACFIGAAWNHASAVQVSALMVMGPTFGYWILRLFVPAFREADEVSMCVCDLTRAEKVEAGLTVVGILMLILIWGMRIFL